MKRSKPLKRSSKPIRRATPARAKQNREYNKRKHAYLMAHQICMVCRVAFAGQVHHIAGRIGARLLDESQWLAVCHKCHDKITSDGKWAQRMGFRTL